jgi:predicted membrane protein
MLIPGVLLLFVLFQKNRNPKIIVTLIIATIALWDVSQFSDGSYESYLAMFGQPYLPVEFSYSQSLERLKIFALIMLIWGMYELVSRLDRKRKDTELP